MRRRMTRGAKALLATIGLVPALAVAMGSQPASATPFTTAAEFSIEGKGAFATVLGNLTIDQPTNALNELPTPGTDLRWVVIPFTINDGRANPNSNVEVAAASGQLQTGVWYENAVGDRLGTPGIRFDGCETEAGRFIVDQFAQLQTAPYTITSLAIRFEHHCNGTVIGSVAWHADDANPRPYAAHRVTGTGLVNGTLDFGTVTSGAPVTKTLRITNTGIRALTIAKIDKAGFGVEDFTVSGCPAGTSIGGPCDITIQANPQIDGPSDATLRIYDQFTGADPGSPFGGGEAITLRVTGQGSGRGRLDLDGEANNNVANGARLVKSGAFSGAGNTFGITGTGVALSITTTTPLVADGVYTIGANASLSLTADGQACASPAGRLHIVELGGNIANLVARFSVTCGTDKALVGQLVYAPTTPIVNRAVTPTNYLIFADPVAVGVGSLPQSVSVTNQGRGDTVVTARLTGAVSEFSLLINGCSGVTLAPGKSCNVVVSFTPTQPGAPIAAVAIKDTFSDQQDRRVFLQGSNATASPGYVWHTDGEFVPLPPARILDTRSDASLNNGVVEPVHAGQPRLVQVTGVGGVPAGFQASAAVLNVTVDGPTSSAYLTVYPTNGSNPPPLASNLNFTAGQTVPNLVVAQLGDGGTVSLYANSGNVNVIIDVVGWITSDGSEVRGSRLEPVAPNRILDTRTGNGGRTTPLGGGQTMTLHVADANDGYTAAVLNLTGTDTTASTFVTAYPSNLATRPTASNLNLVAGQTRPNLVMVQLSPTGDINLFNNAGSVNLIADVVGLYKAGGLRDAQKGRIKPFAPVRVIYTPGGAKLAGGAVQTWDIGTQAAAAGLANMGPGVNSGFIANFTATESTASTFMTAYPSDRPRPTASNLNVLANENVPNLAVVSLSATNTFDVYNLTGSVHYIFDVVARVAS